MRVLVVEDEHKIANAIKKGLEQELYVVDVCYNGLDGYDLALSETYDLIILDLMLPDKDGIDICKSLRLHKNNTPIIMLTAKSQLHDKINGLDSGADDYLTKPFSFEELLARVRALVRRPKDYVNNILNLNDLFLDTKSFTVKKGSIDIILTRKEFSLLEYLLRNTNRVITKDEIISHVWNYDSDILPNTVEAYIKNLRNKIDPNLIQTIRGFGYKIICSKKQD